MINNRRTICILGGTGTVGVTACKVLSKLGYSLRVSVRNIETIKDTGMYMAPNIQLFELDIDKESNIGKAGIPMACVRNGKILPAQKRSPLNLPTRISKLSILPYVTEEIQEIIQGKYMLNIDSYTAAPVSLFSIVNKAHCQKKDLVNALIGQKNSNQKAFIWVRQNKGNDSRCIYFEGKNPSVLTGEILAITANAIFEMPRKDGIYTMASYLEKYQVLDELKKIDKFKSEGKI